jgi:hypothetical protein
LHPIALTINSSTALMTSQHQKAIQHQLGLSHNEMTYYEELWLHADATNEGVLKAAAGVKFFSSSGISRQLLGKVRCALSTMDSAALGLASSGGGCFGVESFSTEIWARGRHWLPRLCSSA